MQSQINILKNGGIGVVPTDTIYGIVGLTLNEKTVERIYQLRKRSLDKPFIILISEIDELKKFDISVTEKQKDFLKCHWPNPLSIVLPITGEKFKYLHRGTNSLAFRMPKNQWVLKLLKQTGPLIAPSANFEGERVAETIEEAKKYFADKVDFYIDRGKIKSSPSTLIQLNDDGKYTVLREGSYKV